VDFFYFSLDFLPKASNCFSNTKSHFRIIFNIRKSYCILLKITIHV